MEDMSDSHDICRAIHLQSSPVIADADPEGPTLSSLRRLHVQTNAGRHRIFGQQVEGLDKSLDDMRRNPAQVFLDTAVDLHIEGPAKSAWIAQVSP